MKIRKTVLRPPLPLFFEGISPMKYILKRVLTLFATMLIVSFLTFLRTATRSARSWMYTLAAFSVRLASAFL